MDKIKKNFNYIKKALTGRIRINDKLKFSAIIYSVAAVHIFLSFIFRHFNILPLFLFNVCSVLTYLACSLLVRREHFWPVYCITYLEIILHSFIATICIGWQYGFAQYIIALTPVGFYICYTMSTGRRKIVIATVSALTATVSFLSCKLLSFFGTPVYEISDTTAELKLYVFNSVCTFIFLIVFSLIFISEIQLSNMQLRYQNEILDKLASTDPLTGLYNRRSMDVFLQQALKSDSGFCVVMCDIDDFKKINDNYGHDFGDIVLKEIANIIVKQVSANGYVCRWGGEEILILVSGSAKENATRIAENIRSNVANHVFELNNKWVHCTLTLGISTYKEGQTVEETITDADGHLYQGKRSGKNKVVA
ncbi:MAG: diguanylate cyclase [Bacteroidales bacterium]|nr:diguanylate cyclase [Lachnoclostridium sp.]MCM1385528.1 diguanylate cyclase [Lachnoclostridium sp.]MCM1466301.1 diguanylate cyclase [Bacteroidales bacterium]